MNSNFVFII